MMILTAFSAADAPAQMRQRSEAPVVHQWRLEELYTHVRTHIFYARTRDYDSSLHRALDRNNIPVEVYHNLIRNVRESLDTFHRYLRLRRRMLGADVLKYSDLYTVEWAYTPHFYYNFYVYQYSTSFTAATALAEEALAGTAGVAQRYRDFISAGGPDYPIDILRRAGVDMTTAEPFRKTIVAMNRTMDDIEAILAHREG